MGIFDRKGKVIQSNLNALLDKAEDDKKLVELNLDEMDEQIKAGHQEVVQAVAAEKQLAKKADELVGDVTRWDKRAELALRSGDEALAREALKQKRRVASELESVERARGEQRDAAVRMKDELERMRQKLGELRLRKGTIASRAAQARRAAVDPSSSVQRAGRVRLITFAAWRRRSRAGRPKGVRWSRWTKLSAKAREPKTLKPNSAISSDRRGGGPPRRAVWAAEQARVRSA